MTEQTWIDTAIGPRVVGGTYHNGYWNDTYTVEAIYRAPDASQWGMRVRWSDGHTTIHSTGWDAKRDCVVTTAAVPERAPAGMLAVRVGSDPWTMVPLDIVTDDPECVECKARTLDTCGGCDEPVCDDCHLEHMGVRHHAAITRLSPVGWDVIDTSTD